MNKDLSQYISATTTLIEYDDNGNVVSTRPSCIYTMTLEQLKALFIDDDID